MKLIAAAAIAVALTISPALAQQTPASGGNSGAGADQGGTGTPGGGTGVPGAVQNGDTATGIGTSATSRQPATAPDAGVGAPASQSPAAPAQ